MILSPIPYAVQSNTIQIMGIKNLKSTWEMVTYSQCLDPSRSKAYHLPIMI